MLHFYQGFFTIIYLIGTYIYFRPFFIREKENIVDVVTLHLNKNNNIIKQNTPFILNMIVDNSVVKHYNIHDIIILKINYNDYTTIYIKSIITSIKNNTFFFYNISDRLTSKKTIELDLKCN